MEHLEMTVFCYGKKDHRLINVKAEQKKPKLLFYKNCTEGNRTVSTSQVKGTTTPENYNTLK